MSFYCDSGCVGVLLNKKFDATSTPSSTQIDTIIDQITKEIDTILYSIGIVTQPTNTNLLGILEKYCSFGSAGTVGMAYFRNASDVEKSNAEWFYAKYEQFLEHLKVNPELFGLISDSSTMYVSNPVIDGTYTESEIEEMFLKKGRYEF